MGSRRLLRQPLENAGIMPPVAKQKRELRKTFLREWRKFRKMSQEKAAEQLNVERSHLSRIERRLVPYSQGLLEAAAEAYGCEPWDLLTVNPGKARDAVDLFDVIRDASPTLRAEILGYAHGRLRAGNDN